ncbi:MAG: hypothetical protein NDI77_07470 [Geobacteraceae bacterium]|nr:hypothetical protein [Geobacteraceae bacterium]
MKARLTLKPGQKGTKALVEKYGAALVCVRHRYDEASRIRTTTVELVEKTKQLPPSLPRIADDDHVRVRIAYGEKSLGQLARSLGGKWDGKGKLWHIRYGKIKGTELEKLMVGTATK